MDLKRIETSQSLCCHLGGYKTFTTCWSGQSGCTVQVWVQVWAHAGHLAISPKAVPKCYRRFRGQNQWPSSWCRSQAQLARVKRASTNTGRFWVGGSRCWQRPASLRKTCYHSCDTDSVQELTRFKCFVNLGQWPLIFFSYDMKILMESARSCCQPKQRP